MKILVVSFHFHPENAPRAFRASALVRKFSDLGHQVTLVIPKFNADRIADDLSFSSVRVVGYPTPWVFESAGWRGFFNKVIHRLFGRHLSRHYFPFVLLKNIVADALNGLKDYDLVLTVAHPHSVHWGVASVMRERGRSLARVWIADSGDPFIGNPFNERFKYLEDYERESLEACDFITVPFAGAMDAYESRFHSKIKVIPQGFDMEEDRKKLLDYVCNPVPTFAYSGTLYPDYRDPRSFLEALCALDTDFRFYIYTSSAGMVKYYQEKSMGRIEVRQPIPRGELLGVLSKMDFLVNIDNVSQVQLPSKLIDYAISRRPILCVDPQSVDMDAVKRFIARDYSAAYDVDEVDQYDINIVASNFLALSAGPGKC